MSSKLPNIIRAHQIARYRYCAELSRLNIMDGIRDNTPQSLAIKRGIELHEWLDKRPHSKDELELEAKLDAYCEERGWFDSTDLSKKRESRFFLRNYKDVSIKAHVDNMRVFWSGGRKVVQCEEYKTTLKKSNVTNPYILRQHEWQLRTYQYILRPIVEELGYVFADQHPITFYHSERGFFLGTHNVPLIQDADFEIEFNYVMRVWQGLEEPKLPASFKCKTCPFEFKSRCKLRQAWLDGTLMVPDSGLRLWTEPLPKGAMIEFWEDDE